MRFAFFAAAMLAVPCSTFASTIWVPDDHATIQAAIDAAANGDEVVVRAGTYVENIDFRGKAITVRSLSGPAETTIDGNGLGSVVTFAGGEMNDSRLEGFTITNGARAHATWRIGGGIYCENSSPTIVGNVIEGNSASWGGGGIGVNGTFSVPHVLIEGNWIRGNASGGIYAPDGLLDIRGNEICDNAGTGISGDYTTGIYAFDNVISGNTGWGINYCMGGVIEGNLILANGEDGIYTADYYLADERVPYAYIDHNVILDKAGAGIYLDMATRQLTNNLIAGNGGGGIRGTNDVYLDLSNCTLVGNTSNSIAGGISIFRGICRITSCILWNNIGPLGPEIAVGSGWNEFGVLKMRYSDVRGGPGSVYVEPGNTLVWAGGMFDADPLFIDEGGGDYRLQQDPAQPGIVNPCVDTGYTLATMIEGATRTDWVQDTGRIDVGFHYAIPASSATFRNRGTNPASHTALPPPARDDVHRASRPRRHHRP